MAGPLYHKIHSAFKRDASARNTVIPGDWSQDEFRYLKDMPWRWTEKIDGTNIRLHWDGAKVTIGGRTDSASIPAHLAAYLMELTRDTATWERMWPLEDPAHPARSNPSVTVYGEGYGPKIQKGGGLYRDTPGFIVFDVRVGDWWLTPGNVKNVADGLGMETVPEYPALRSPVQMWDVICAGKLTSKWADRGVQAEGVVGVPEVPLRSRNGERVIMKMKAKDWEDLKRLGRY